MAPLTLRPIPNVIDLTGDDDSVPSPVEASTAPSSSGRPAKRIHVPLPGSDRPLHKRKSVRSPKRHVPSNFSGGSLSSLPRPGLHLPGVRPHVEAKRDGASSTSPQERKALLRSNVAGNDVKTSTASLSASTASGGGEWSARNRNSRRQFKRTPRESANTSSSQLVRSDPPGVARVVASGQNASSPASPAYVSGHQVGESGAFKASELGHSIPRKRTADGSPKITNQTQELESTYNKVLGSTKDDGRSSFAALLKQAEEAAGETDAEELATQTPNPRSNGITHSVHSSVVERAVEGPIFAKEQFRRRAHALEDTEPTKKPSLSNGSPEPVPYTHGQTPPQHKGPHRAPLASSMGASNDLVTPFTSKTETSHPLARSHSPPMRAKEGVPHRRNRNGQSPRQITHSATDSRRAITASRRSSATLDRVQSSRIPRPNNTTRSDSAPLGLPDSNKRGNNLANGSTQPPPFERTVTKEERKKGGAVPGNDGKPYTKEDDELIIHLKEVSNANWPEIAVQLQRTMGSCQTRYSKHLRGRNTTSQPPHADPSKPTLPRDLPALGSIPQPLASSVVPTPERHVSHLGDQKRPLHVTLDPDPELDKEQAETDQKSSIVATEPQAAPFRSEGSKHSLRPLRDELMVYDLASAQLLNETHSAEATTAATKTAKCRKAAAHSRVLKPYLGLKERDMLQRGFDEGEWSQRRAIQWRGSVVHTDFDEGEVETLRNVVLDTIRMHGIPIGLNSSISTLMSGATPAEIFEISWQAVKRKELRGRAREDVESFLTDLLHSRVSGRPCRQRLGQLVPLVRPDRALPSSKSALLHQRELGLYGRQSWRATRAVNTELENRLYDSIGPSLHYTGTSGDVGTVAWAPDGRMFAAGSVCLMDPSSMQYNRPNNLLFGDSDRKTLQELPDHFQRREKPETGVNSTHSMHVSQDHRLFMTVSMVDFSPDGRLLYSAGFDGTVRAWDLEGRSAHLRHTVRLKAPVDLLAVNRTSGLVATGCQRSSEKSIRILKCDPIKCTIEANFTSPKAAARPETRTFPSCLRWGINSRVSKYLLAGFSSTSQDEGRDNYGEMCLWEVERGVPINLTGASKNIFDCAWNPLGHSFAFGSAPINNVNRGTRSVVRVYDPHSWNRFGLMVELECPALDMNDVVYCPFDQNILSASCTDGKTYVWDVRSYHRILHTLSHGKPLMELDESASRELVDTGVRFCSWGENNSRFYTGSSDGIVKAWNIHRAPEDVFVKDVASLNSGVMSGAFSPDFTSLLLGEVNGSINVLEVGRDDTSVKDMERLKLLPATRSAIATNPTTENTDEDSGTKAAADLVKSKQITLVPLGALPIRQAVKGPNYNGPFDLAPDSHVLRAQAEYFWHQSSASLGSGEPCQIPACRDSQLKITSEESGDSGRSQDRIPDALRSARTADTSTLELTAGMAKCFHCGSPARPRLGEGDPAKPLCERCAFTCFRCGAVARVSRKTESVRCRQCNRKWTADVLGFYLEEKFGRKGKEKRVGNSAAAEVGGAQAATGMYEDLNLLDEVEEYYHSLWQDRPPSPL